MNAPYAVLGVSQNATDAVVLYGGKSPCPK